MKPWAIFVFDCDHPNGGLQDLHGLYSSHKEAMAILRALDGYDWVSVVNLQSLVTLGDISLVNETEQDDLELADAKWEVVETVRPTPVCAVCKGEIASFHGQQICEKCMSRVHNLYATRIRSGIFGSGFTT